MKRKVFLVVLFLSMMIFSVSVHAEILEIDLEKCTLEELASLRSSIENEISLRIGLTEYEDSSIGAGIYEIGKDVKTGKYDFICATVSSGEYSNPRVVIADLKTETPISMTEVSVGSIATLNLEEGYHLGIFECSGRLVPSKHSWQP